jgi:Domain of unknown function (DUF6504)
MRRYDDPVEVRTGRVAGTGDHLVEGPEQFVWKGRLWKVHTVVAQWVETGPWWQSSGVHAVLGADDGALDGAGSTDPDPRAEVRTDLAAEREVWRVEADRGRTAGLGRGVFDLVFDWADGSWRLTRCLD